MPPAPRPFVGEHRLRAASYPPESVPPGLRALRDGVAAQVARHLGGFAAARDDGAPVGPFPPMLRFPRFGRRAWAYAEALVEHSALAAAAREAAARDGAVGPVASCAVAVRGRGRSARRSTNPETMKRGTTR